MSRYEFEGNEPGVSIVVGWDNPLKTFFAQVWERGGPPPGCLRLWVGAGDRVPLVEGLAELVAPYGDIPADVVTQLEADFDQ
jgi:hypothetical protein